MSSTNSYIRKLIDTDVLREPVIRSVVKALKLPATSEGLDVGCGIGLQTLLLCEEIGPDCHVTGLDISSEFLKYASEVIGKSGKANQISLKQGDFNNLPFEDNRFDWVWSMDCAGYATGNKYRTIKELARVIKPGGTLAIAAWSSQQLLPGYPLLEAKLNTTYSGILPFRQGNNPDEHFFRALGWFREAGLVERRAMAFAGSVHAPLTDDIRKSLISLIGMRWENVESELSQKEKDLFRLLTDPESPEFILNLKDYYAFFTYSLFYGNTT
ncbi:MAG: class I SAM-dependent methyltransferase [candidate division Zixibacteria bacterium]|nr:class I SAM-dependent methyltransferase [candidate division Zixibacteria bacterium]